MIFKDKLVHLTVSLAMCGLTVFLGYFAQRSDFWAFLAAYLVFFGLYGWVLAQMSVLAEEPSRQRLSRYYTGLGIALRVLLLFSLPNFSDDLYRFLWDGCLTMAGIHPFAHTPAWFVENQIFPPGTSPELYALLNSPRYFTVYPPVCQAVFALAAWLAPNNIWGGMLVMKLLLLACEIGTISVLSKFDFTKAIRPSACRDSSCIIHHSSLLYALNPLLLLEVVGNCHFEGAMIFFLLAGLWGLRQGRAVQPAVLWALAVASKLVPLMFLPLVWRWLGWWRGSVFLLVFGAASVLLFAPLLQPEVLSNMSRSLDLYFQKFQFNASVYYLLRAVGLWQTGFDRGDLIGPGLGLAVLLGVLAWTAFRLRAGMPFGVLVEALLFATFLQLSCAATVHPWYVTVPLALSLLTERWWRVGVAWSCVVALSYSHYADGFFRENYALIALEYAVVWAALIWALRKN